MGENEPKKKGEREEGEKRRTTLTRLVKGLDSFRVLGTMLDPEMNWPGYEPTLSQDAAMRMTPHVSRMLPENLDEGGPRPLHWVGISPSQGSHEVHPHHLGEPRPRSERGRERASACPTSYFSFWLSRPVTPRRSPDLHV